ncbi:MULTISPECIES: hypothetical protein [unclassified Vibrio]|uniref:hypothetical protein n=1 Tax=unclassified Vibrio TaxID=2614977 RepID=UPI0012687B66|nr:MULTISPECIES: hypothetical protein [unclassified Vibrio]QFT39813.1 hypothetical protein FIU99_25850 [Vibrio sp. THAF64]QGM37680.1 hypothetical protein GGC04_25630 [Vibrio sp. THAF191d]QGN73401.1 hypothetical protein GGC03_26805 [Vibrio sp. THAF191c]
MNFEQFVKNVNLNKNGRLNGVKQISIYYVYTGLNAWHSTYSATYTNRCMHPNLPSAKDYCENNRVQGSVFHILKLPALAFHTKFRTLIVTEINSNSPLSRFSIEKFLSNKNVQKSEVGKLAWTTDLNTLVDCFDAYLGSWEVPSKSRHSVLMFDGTSVKLEVSRSNNLNHFCSKSVGGGYYLQWSESGSDIIRDGTRKVERLFFQKRELPSVRE